MAPQVTNFCIKEPGSGGQYDFSYVEDEDYKAMEAADATDGRG
jgi:hypothetical protein